MRRRRIQVEPVRLRLELLIVGQIFSIQVLMGTIVRDGDVMWLGSGHYVQVKTGGEVGWWRCGANLRRLNLEEVVHCDV